MKNSSGHLSNTQKIKNLILDGSVQTLLSEIKTIPKFHCQRSKCLLPRIRNNKKSFACLAELFKTEFNLMSLSFCSNDHRRISLPHPLPFESECVFGGMCILETVMVEMGMGISNI